MKFYFTVIIAFFVSILTFAQNGDHNYGIMKDSVVVVEGLSASEIYNSVIAWTRRHDDSIKDHDIMEVKNQGQLNLQGTLTNQITFSGAKWQGFSGPLVCTWDIRIKDGKFRIRMYDYILNNTYVGYIYNKEEYLFKEKDFHTFILLFGKTSIKHLKQESAVYLSPF